ncbi:hypothetical protein AOLI_G00289440 [Acnodon oligacanthus]
MLRAFSEGRATLAQHEAGITAALAAALQPHAARLPQQRRPNSFSLSFLTTISELTLDHRQEPRLNVQKENSLDMPDSLFYNFILKLSELERRKDEVLIIQQQVKQKQNKIIENRIQQC